MKGRQLCGTIAIAIMAVSVYAARDLLCSVRSAGETVVATRWEGTEIAVELVGDPDHAGIYFLHEGSTIGTLLREAGIDNPLRFIENIPDKTIHAGDRVVCDTDDFRVTIGEMSAATRIALGMRIDLNGAARDELVLVPGIGLHTAALIVEFREKRGYFSRLDELKDVSGIGEKRYDGIRRYLYIKESSCS